MTGTRRDLTESEREAITSALRIASDEFAAIAQTSRTAAFDIKNSDGPKTDPDHAIAHHLRLAAQFERQRAEALVLANLIEQADAIAVTILPESMTGLEDAAPSGG